MRNERGYNPVTIPPAVLSDEAAEFLMNKVKIVQTSILQPVLKP